MNSGPESENQIYNEAVIATLQKRLDKIKAEGMGHPGHEARQKTMQAIVDYAKDVVKNAEGIADIKINLNDMIDNMRRQLSSTNPPKELRNITLADFNTGTQPKSSSVSVMNLAFSKQKPDSQFAKMLEEIKGFDKKSTQELKAIKDNIPKPTSQKKNLKNH